MTPCISAIIKVRFAARHNMLHNNNSNKSNNNKNNANDNDNNFLERPKTLQCPFPTLLKFL